MLHARGAQKWALDSFGTGDIAGQKPPCRFWEVNSGCEGELEATLPIKPCFQLQTVLL